MEKKRIRKRAIFVLAGLIITLALLNLASAESWACFTKSQKINFCNPKTPDRTCANTVCMYCTASYNEAEQCYTQGNFNTCNSISPECATQGNGGVDSEPPVLTILNPEEGRVYTERSVLLKLLVDEIASISYADNSESRLRWTRVCNECSSYEKPRSFKEGKNNLIFMAEDVVGNTAFKELMFFIDSRIPKITKTLPKKGLISSTFRVEFKEENPSTLTLNYGNEAKGFRSSALDITKCSLLRGRYSCNKEIALADFNSQEISYWFELTDIAGNSVSSKPLMLEVDTTPPIINSLKQEIHENHLRLEILITEQNFEAVEYIDNSASRPRWRTLCSRLDNGLCEKQVTLPSGMHDIDIKVSDGAGNSALRNIDIII